jgi:hypothetical protein
MFGFDIGIGIQAAYTLMLADDYQITNALDLSKTPERLVERERILTGLYPDSETLSVACHSGVNYHLYSLVKGSRKLRYKRVVHGSGKRILPMGCVRFQNCRFPNVGVASFCQHLFRSSL